MNAARKRREQTAARQSALRTRRAASGHIRREYWATKTEHAEIVKRLDKLQGKK